MSDGHCSKTSTSGTFSPPSRAHATIKSFSETSSTPAFLTWVWSRDRRFATVRAEAPTLRKDAAAVAEIIGEWRRTADDKSFAMRTRFFPSGVKIPVVKWTD